MEDVLKFLFVAAVIVFGLVRQFKKEADNKAESTPPTPMPTDPTEHNVPTPPEKEEQTYGGYSPQSPEVIMKPAPKQPKPIHVSSSPKAKPGHSPKITLASQTKISAPAPTLQEAEAISEFSIHSTEEARKAIIWSEILRRKY